MTLMTWFKAESFGDAETRLISKSSSTADSDHWWTLGTSKQGNAHRLRFRLRSLFGSNKILTASSGDLVAGQWYFAAATFDGFNMRLYLNGQQVGSPFMSGWVGINTQIPVWIGDNAPGSPRGMLFRHMNQLQAAGSTDLRPLSGPLTVRSTTLNQATRTLLSGELGVPLVDDPSIQTADYSSFSPTAVSDYQLYPGGARYTIATLNSRVSNQQLGPEVTTNPLGVYRATDDVQLQDSLQLQGVLLGARDVEFSGTNIQLEGIDLPLLYGSSERIQLPCACVGRRLEFLADSTVQTNGMLVVADYTRFKSDDASMTATITGRLATGGLIINPREPWANTTAAQWNAGTLAFEQQRYSANGIRHFPTWLNSEGISLNPHIKIAPPSDNIRFHWHDWTQPLFLPATEGSGLRWNVLRWDDQA